MKKQFFRVKQLADQTFLRADKSEDLNYEELQNADRKIEYLKGALNAISKRIPNDIANQIENYDKRLKKYAEYQLGMVLSDQANRKVVEGSESIGKSDDSCKLFKEILRECSEVELNLANELAHYENSMESMVSKPIQDVLEKELPNVIKLKKNLSKHILDKDSANNRYNAAKHSSQRDSIKAEMDEADTKVEQSRDALASEMFNILRKESELSQYMLQILKLQRAYHESALKYLESVIPNLESKIGDSNIKPVFGQALENHLKVTKRKLAYPLEICICALTKLGMSEEGLFRMGGSLTRVKRLKLSIDSGCFSYPLLPEYRDVHVLASTLKMYLRELPEPILTSILYNEWIESMKYPEEQRINAVQNIILKLPKANRDNLTYLIKFLAQLSQHPETKMNSSNIAIVIAPNLLWQNTEIENMSDCALINMIVEFFINNVDELFPEDVSKYFSITPFDLFGEDEFERPHLSNLKLNIMIDADCLMQSETASPKPQHRKKKPAAPIPPANNLIASCPSGSSTMTRSHKTKSIENSRSQSTASLTDDETLQLHSNRQMLVMDDINNSENKLLDVSKMSIVSLDDSKQADHKIVVSQSSTNILLSSAKPVQQVTAQLTTTNFSTGSIYSYNKPIVLGTTTVTKPVAAPRIICSDNDKAGIRTMLNVENVSSQSLHSLEIEGDLVQVRKQSRDDGCDRLGKPAIPARPASLKTQCSVYSVAHKQQPSIVNIQNREVYQAGHDSQIAEKEKFLGHQPERVPVPRTSLENKQSDINFNSNYTRIRCPSVSNNKHCLHLESPHIKSNEVLNSACSENCNGNSKPSHIRTRSDGNIVNTNTDIPIISASFLTTPPSPRSLNKPTQPPPPPPIISNRSKTENDSTDL